jgi:UDP-N-acetylmuramoyl-tripeptide--D-alanyl-D-alanine ligase
MNVFPGINGSTIIDDTYNSSPIALEVALDTLADVKVEKNNGRKIAIIGDMLELGSVSPASHETAGKHVAKEKFDVLVTVGVRAKGIAEAAIVDGMSPDAVFSYPDSKDQEMQSDIKDMIQKGDVVLVKGSQGSRMERISKVLLSPEIDPKDALVRQESVWETK